MSRWPTVTLAEVCEQDRRHTRGESHLPYVGLEHVTSGTGDILLSNRADEGPNGAAFLFDDRHVLYGKLRPYLNKVALPEFSGRCSMELIPLLPHAGVLRGYVAALLRHPRVVAEAAGRNTGSRMPRADMRLLMGLEVPLPPLDEQRRIVDILNHAASIRRLREQAKAKAKELIPSLFLDMFGDPATNPKRWDIVELGTLISNGPQNGPYRPKTDYGSGIPILRIDSFYDGRVVDLSRLQRIRLDPATIRVFSLHENDIVINRINSRPFLGKSTIVPALLEPTVFESNMMRFAVWEEIALPQYVVQALQNSNVKQQILSNSKDAINQSSINQKDVRNLRILRPPVAAQEAFVERVADIQTTIDQMDRAAAAAEQLQAALMARLFDGAGA
jgi:type I restriction enzyme S subunit